MDMVVFAISDGVVADHEIPLSGTVYTFSDYRDKVYHSTSVKASWIGFTDRHSYVEEYQYAICPPGETPIFKSVALNNHIEEDITKYVHGHEYEIHVKAIDAAGHESDVATSNTFLVDKTEPTLLSCLNEVISLQSFLACACRPIAENGFAEYCECSTNDTVDVICNTMYRVRIETYIEPNGNPIRFEIGSHTDWVVFNHVRRNMYEFDTYFVASHISSLSPKLVTDYHVDTFMVKIYKCTDASSDGELTLYQSGNYGIRVIHPFIDLESYVSNIQIGLGTNIGGFQLLSLQDFGNESTSFISLPLQHKMTIYGTTIVTNNAGLQTVATSKPVVVDWSPPVVENITVHIWSTHPNLIAIDAAWNVIDKDTAVTGCFWSIGSVLNQSYK